jgi:predicted PhzF superfamily epimerase YddE/YHI9
MTVLRIAAFSDGNQGGNPAGIWIGDELPTVSKMQATAADVGFSETAFAAPEVTHGAFGIFRRSVKCRFVGTPPSLSEQLLHFNRATEPLN